MPKTIPCYDKSFVSYGKLKQKSLSPPRKPADPYSSSEIESLGKLFSAFFLGKLIFCRDIMLRVAKNRMSVEF